MGNNNSNFNLFNDKIINTNAFSNENIRPYTRTTINSSDSRSNSEDNEDSKNSLTIFNKKSETFEDDETPRKMEYTKENILQSAMRKKKTAKEIAQPLLDNAKGAYEALNQGVRIYLFIILNY